MLVRHSFSQQSRTVTLHNFLGSVEGRDWRTSTDGGGMTLAVEAGFSGEAFAAQVALRGSGVEVTHS